MGSKSRQFEEQPDDFGFNLDISDADLEAMMSGGATSEEAQSLDLEQLEPGDRIHGVVVDLRGGELLVEIDSKTHGSIEETEFPEGEELPAIGSEIVANFVRYDNNRDLVILSVHEARKEVFWEELRPGVILEGTVTATNRGGLTLDIKGARAFLPISQIELSRVEDLEPYVGKKLRVEVTQFDRADKNLVVSRREILQRQAEEMRGMALARLHEGEVLMGTITRINDYGAFIDLGGVEGLLHASKIRKELGQKDELEVGARLEVEVQHIDAERERIGLDFKSITTSDWHTTIEGYAAGDEVTGWVSRLDQDGAWVSIEEGVEGIITRTFLLDLADQPQRGSIVRAKIQKIDQDRERIELRPID